MDRLSSIESSDLRIFRAVAYEGSTTRAAQSLGYVQSNVTGRIRQLESRLNTPLFYRRHGMTLTPAGVKLLDYAERILQLLDEAQKALSDDHEPSGQLTIGAYFTVSALQLPNFLAEYHASYPNVKLSLTTDHSTALAEKVRHFELDCAFVSSPFTDNRIEAELVHEDELVLISSPGDRDIDEVCSKPFLMNTNGCFHRERLESWLKMNGIGLPRYMEFSHMEAIIGGVIAGLGASLVPRSAVELHLQSGLVRSFRISREYSLARTYVIRNKASLTTNALSRFLEMVKSEGLSYRPNLCSLR